MVEMPCRDRTGVHMARSIRSRPDRGADAWELRLTNATLTHTTLVHAVLTDANLTGESLTDTNLTSATFCRTTMSDAETTRIAE
jgi:uncharacterized protein YjbI with pentapeptide repeats